MQCTNLRGSAPAGTAIRRPPSSTTTRSTSIHRAGRIDNEGKVPITRRDEGYTTGDFQCIRKGKDFCFAFTGLNQYHAIMDYGTCPAVASSSSAVALLGLNASIELTSAKNGKRTVPIGEFYVQPDANRTKFTVIQPDELLTAVMIPKPAPGTRSAYQKYGEMESFDWAIADAGAILEMDGNTCRCTPVRKCYEAPEE